MQSEKISKLSKKIGIVGGGQLGKMMIAEAKKMGFYVAVIDPTENCPCHSVCDYHIVAPFNDRDAINELGGLCDVITYELEHIGVEQLEVLEKSGKAVYPTCKSLRIIQNKLEQKKALKLAGVPVPEFWGVSSPGEIEGYCDSYPKILKTATGGYDGKGNFVINDLVGIEKGFSALGGGKFPLMIEEYIPFELEISVLACRGIDGETVVYPVGKNIHKDNILEKTIVPAPISAHTARLAEQTAERVMEVFEGVGMFCVEMFVLSDGSVLVNEVAPRPHNSGHYTIEACSVSQFEQHIRAITGLPLGKVKLLAPAVMANILGENGYDGKAVVAGAEEALKQKNIFLHIYGKEMTVPKRKMGHLTVCGFDGESVKECIKTAEKAASLVKVLSD